jgi:hypothetical protein
MSARGFVLATVILLGCGAVEPEPVSGEGDPTTADVASADAKRVLNRLAGNWFRDAPTGEFYEAEIFFTGERWAWYRHWKTCEDPCKKSEDEGGLPHVVQILEDQDDRMSAYVSVDLESHWYYGETGGDFKIIQGTQAFWVSRSGPQELKLQERAPGAPLLVFVRRLGGGIQP